MKKKEIFNDFKIELQDFFLKLNIYFSLINDIKLVQKEWMGNFFIIYIVFSFFQFDRNYLKCEKKYYVNQR